MIVNVALEVSYGRSYNCESFFETKNFCLNNTFLFLKLIKIVWDDLSTKNFRIFLSKGLFYEDLRQLFEKRLHELGTNQTAVQKLINIESELHTLEARGKAYIILQDHLDDDI